MTVAEGASDAPAAFERFGLIREALGRPVRFMDLNRDESEWDELDLRAVDGSSMRARLSRTVASAECRISLALMKTHVSSMVTFSLKNMLSSLHPQDRVMMHGHAGGGNGYSGWRRLIVEFLKGDNPLVNALTRSMGRIKSLVRHPLEYDRLSLADKRFLKSVVALNANLAALAVRTRPHLSVIDGFDAMHREGPRHGTPIRLGLAIAGTDPVAVDSVATALMGFDPKDIGYLQMAESLGVGTADLDRIEVVGDPIAKVGRLCVAHSNAAIARFWQEPTGGRTIPRPHLQSTEKASRR